MGIRLQYKSWCRYDLGIWFLMVIAFGMSSKIALDTTSEHTKAQVSNL